MDDITFCWNGFEECGLTRCERHPSNISDRSIPHSFAKLYRTEYCPLEMPKVADMVEGEDLISRQAAIDTLIEKKIYRPLDSDRYVIEYCIDAIKTLPAADAVSVVRCKDCKYWDVFPSSSVTPDFHECKGLGVHTVADFFCSKGEEN